LGCSATGERSKTSSSQQFSAVLSGSLPRAGIADTHVRVALAEHDALGHDLALAVEAMDDGGVIA